MMYAWGCFELRSHDAPHPQRQVEAVGQVCLWTVQSQEEGHLLPELVHPVHAHRFLGVAFVFGERNSIKNED